MLGWQLNDYGVCRMYHCSVLYPSFHTEAVLNILQRIELLTRNRACLFTRYESVKMSIRNVVIQHPEGNNLSGKHVPSFVRLPSALHSPPINIIFLPLLIQFRVFFRSWRCALGLHVLLRLNAAA
jgi:hypothetical protein